MVIYICDDSKPDLMRLAHHLKEYIQNLDMNIEIRSFSSGESILAAYERALVKPSLIFLDIYMGNMNGMEVAKALRGDGFANGIIFTTSSTSHAMDSYNVNALYYLQKPYDHNDFTNAINRCSSIFTEAAKTYTVSIRGKDTPCYSGTHAYRYLFLHKGVNGSPRRFTELHGVFSRRAQLSDQPPVYQRGYRHQHCNDEFCRNIYPGASARDHPEAAQQRQSSIPLTVCSHSSSTPGSSVCTFSAFFSLHAFSSV